MSECVVYWLFNEDCVCPQLHGYVGITSRFKTRIKQHRYSGAFPDNFQAIIIHEGTVDDCFEIEQQLRPTHRIGWNKLKGGHYRNHSLGCTHSEETRAKLSAALKGREIKWSDRIAATLTGHKRTVESRAKQSASAKGQAKSPEWRAKMSEMAKARGGFGPKKLSAETRALLSEQRKGNRFAVGNRGWAIREARRAARKQEET